jgi:HK97 family phage prohead protease/HK97 family phage major capsid protein
VPVDVTENFIRIRVAEPKEFQRDSFRIIWISKKDGIKAVAGRKKGSTKLSVQSFLFDKKKWSVQKAKKWVKDHGYTIKSFDGNLNKTIPSQDNGFKNLVVPFSKQLDSNDQQWELIIEARASTPTPDRGGDVVLPTAFARTMPEFMATQPVMMFNHMPDWTIGKILDYRIDEEGLWVRGGIAPTERGKEVATLIRHGIVTGMSFRYDVVDIERGEDGKPNVIKEVNVYEIGPVSIPMNPEAVIEQAKQKGIQLKSLTAPLEAGGQNTGVNTMNETQVRTLIDSSVAPVAGGLKDTEAKVSELSNRFEQLAKLQNELKDVVRDNTKTSGELRELIDRASGDFSKALKELSDEINQLKIRKSVVSAESMPNTLDELIHMEPSEVEALYPQKAALIKTVQRHYDAVLLKDALMQAESMSEGGSYHTQPRHERIKSFEEYKRMMEFAKALDTATSGEGLDLVPTDFSGTIHELIRAKLKVAGLFEIFPMPTKSYKLPVETADVIATLQGEKTTVQTGWDSTEQTPTTSNAALTAVKARARIQISTELTEDSVVPIIPWVENQAARAIVRAIERGIINGQATADIDTGYGGIASTDFRKAWDGLRYHYQNSLTSLGVDLSTFSAANLRTVRKNMGVYGLYPDELAWICSIKGYLGQFLKNVSDVQTMDKYGPNATILSGELAKFDGIPIIVSEFVQDDLNASGIYDGTTTTQTIVILVNRQAWVIGNRRETTITVVRDQINDIYNVVAFWRGDFKPWWTPSTSAPIVNIGYNITA